MVALARCRRHRLTQTVGPQTRNLERGDIQKKTLLSNDGQEKTRVTVPGRWLQVRTSVFGSSLCIAWALSEVSSRSAYLLVTLLFICGVFQTLVFQPALFPFTPTWRRLPAHTFCTLVVVRGFQCTTSIYIGTLANLLVGSLINPWRNLCLFQISSALVSSHLSRTW